jgi:murein DD-endopeptidase MepM/ murein hydrolase activator NlpD
MSLFLHNPVGGYIHPRSWIRPSGSLAFKVTQNYGCTGVLAERPLGTCPHFHRAIDIGNSHSGAPVLAAKAGVVVYRGVNDGSLNIVINHGGGVYTGYTHLSAARVVKGQHVVAGQQIGNLGSSGATAAHLHFALKTGITVVMTYPYAGFWGDVRGHWANPWLNLAQNS